jgi:hypothetical protein
MRARNPLAATAVKGSTTGLQAKSGPKRRSDKYLQIFNQVTRFCARFLPRRAARQNIVARRWQKPLKMSV